MTNDTQSKISPELKGEAMSSNAIIHVPEPKALPTPPNLPTKPPEIIWTLNQKVIFTIAMIGTVCSVLRLVEVKSPLDWPDYIVIAILVASGCTLFFLIAPILFSPSDEPK